MAKVKSKGNRSTELRALRIFKEIGLSGWRRNYPVFGKPDFVFLQFKVAVFIDGCFWHGCMEYCRMPNSNQEYWEKKIRRNKARDKEVAHVFVKRGWRVVRIWEHDLKKPYSLKQFKRLQKLLSQ